MHALCMCGHVHKSAVAAGSYSAPHSQAGITGSCEPVDWDAGT